MDNEILESPFRTLARERSHEEARQTVATNRMLVQSLVIINGGAAVAVLAYLGAHNASGAGKSAALLTIVLYCLGVFAAIFAGLYIRRTTQELSSFWELKSYPDSAEREKITEGHRKQAIRGKRWSTGLLVCSEVFFLAASLSLAISLG
jgi:ABC-type transport system involved in cytochrome bd biosynthesis fused ATPase/permease subunit